MDCSLPGSSVYGIFWARILEWVAIAFSRGSFWPRDRTRVSRIVGRCFTVWATRTKLNNKAQSPQLSNLHFYLLLLGSGAGPRVQQDRPLSSTAALPSLLSHSGGPTLGPRGPQLTGPPWLRRVRLCDPTDRSTPGLPSIYQLPESTQTHVHWVGDAIHPSRPLSSPSPPTFNLSQHQDPVSQLFASSGQRLGAAASASVLPMNTFRIDWFDLLAVQGTLKSLL